MIYKSIHLPTTTSIYFYATSRTTSTKRRSLDLVERDDGARLHVLFEALDHVGDVVHEHQLVHDGAGHDDLLHAEGNGLQLVLFAPRQPVDLVLRKRSRRRRRRRKVATE